MVTGWYRNLVTRTLPQLHEPWSVAEETAHQPPGMLRFVPNEPRPFAMLHDIQALRSPNVPQRFHEKSSIGIMPNLT
jgi:hypothetical protein